MREFRLKWNPARLKNLAWVLLPTILISAAAYLMDKVSFHLTKPYIACTEVIPAGEFYVQSYTIINPGPADLKETIFTFSKRAKGKNTGKDIDPGLIKFDRSRNSILLEAQDNDCIINESFQLYNNNGNKLLRAGESIGFTVIWPAIFGEDPLTKLGLTAEARQISAEVKDAIFSRPSFAAMLKNTLYLLVAVLCIIIIFFSSIFDIETPDSKAIDISKNSMDGSSKVVGEIDAEVKLSRIPPAC